MALTAAVAPDAGTPSRRARQADRRPARPRSDGRQAGNGRRTGGARPGVLLLVRGLPGGRARDPAPDRGAGSPGPTGITASRRSTRLVGGRRRAGRLALSQARTAGPRIGRPTDRVSRGALRRRRKKTAGRGREEKGDAA